MAVGAKVAVNGGWVHGWLLIDGMLMPRAFL